MIQSRIGNDLNILWPIRVNGEDATLDNIELYLELTDPFGGKSSLPFPLANPLLSAQHGTESIKNISAHILLLYG